MWADKVFIPSEYCSSGAQVRGLINVQELHPRSYDIEF